MSFDATPWIVEQIGVTIPTLKEAWGWLDELVVPGRDSAPIPLQTDAQRALAAALAEAERAERAYALPATPAAARVAILDARAAVHALVLDAARTVAAAAGAVYIGQRPGADGVLDALDWIAGEAPDLRDPEAAADVDGALQRALRIARAAARDAGEHVAPVDERCPACGHRSLQLDYGSDEQLREGLDNERARRGWTVTCISQACRCAGPGCGCGQRVRYPGRRHVWAYGALPELWAATAAARHRRRGPETRIGSEAAGHGGWIGRVPRRVGRAVRDAAGVLWWDRERSCAQLGIRPQMLWDWVRRSRTEPDFPPLVPRRDGPVTWYRAEQLLDVEWHLAQSTRGRRRAT